MMMTKKVRTGKNRQEEIRRNVKENVSAKRNVQENAAENARRKTPKAALYLAAAGSCAILFSGCGNSMQTEEELVIPRTEGMEGQTTAGGAGGEGQAAAGGAGTDAAAQVQNGQNQGTADNGAAGSEVADNVAAQVQAPERYQTEIKEENIVLKADAVVEIPDVPGIKTKKVAARFFTQEDYDTVNTVLFDGGKLWERDYEAMAETHGFTVEELRVKLATLEAEKAKGVDGDAPYGDTDRTLNQRIAECQAMLEAAEANGTAEVAVLKELPAIVEPGGTSGADWTALDGFVTYQGHDYSVYMLNHMDKTWRWTIFSAQKDNYQYYGDYMSSYEDLKEVEGKTAGVQLNPEEIAAQAGEALEQMGMEDFTVQDGEYFATYELVGTWADADKRTYVDKIGYGVHVIRMIDGIPVGYTRQNANSMPEDESVSWPFEEMQFVYDEDGLASFYWSSPYEIEELSSDYVFLLPFSDIQNIFEQMVIKEKKDGFLEECSSMEINIDRISLNYMRIREKNATEGTLVPVWDFFGTQIWKDSNGEVSYIRQGAYESILTINAMDGTIIDRNIGY